MQRIRDCSVFSLQGNEYASCPFSKLRDHCRRGYQMSVRTRSSRWSQANIMFLSQQDSPTYELTAVGEHLQDLCKHKPAKISPWRGELRTSQMGWERFHPISLEFYISLDFKCWKQYLLPKYSHGSKKWQHTSIISEIESQRQGTTALKDSLVVYKRGPLLIQRKSGGSQNKFQISWSYILRTYSKNEVHSCLRLSKLFYL